VTGFVLNKLTLKGEEYPFVMELPPYRIPTLKSALLHMWDKAKHYLKRIGITVLIFSMILWFLGNYPKNYELQKSYTTKINTIKKSMNKIKNTKNYLFINKKNKLNNLKTEYNEKKIQYTFVGRFGQFIEPVLKPIGFDWKIGITLISGFVAKEIIVSTMGVLYTSSENNNSLQSILTKLYIPLQGFILMIFVLLYIPCMATVATMYQELKSLKWFLIGITYPILLAWGVSFFIYQVGLLVISG